MDTLCMELRIPVVLAASQHKPPDQSFAAYTLDLQCRYNHERSIDTDGDPWRERALVLEESLASMRAETERIKLELFEMHARYPIQTSAMTEAPASSPMLPTPANLKKKTKKKRSDQPQIDPMITTKPDMSDAVERMQCVSFLPLTETSSLLSALRSLSSLHSSAISQDPTSYDAILATVKRTIETIGRLLKAQSSPDRITSSETIKILDAASAILIQLLPISANLLLPPFSLRSSKGKAKPADVRTHDTEMAFAKVVSQMSTSILKPILRSFTLASHVFLSSLRAERKSNGVREKPDEHDVADCRPALLQFLQTTLAALDDLDAKNGSHMSRMVADVKEMVALEAARELVELFSSSGSPLDSSTDHPSVATPLNLRRSHRSRSQHITALANKDTLWYLCNVLHRVLPPSSIIESAVTAPDRSRSAQKAKSFCRRNTLLQQGILDTLSTILRMTCLPQRSSEPPVRCDGMPPNSCTSQTGDQSNSQQEREWVGQGVGEVERGMILAIIERAWLGGLGDGEESL